MHALRHFRHLAQAQRPRAEYMIQFPGVVPVISHRLFASSSSSPVQPFIYDHGKQAKAIAKAQKERVEYLIKLGVDPEIAEKQSLILLSSSLNGNIQAKVEYLIDLGVTSEKIVEALAHHNDVFYGVKN